jgi:hypothetical protein
MPKITVSSTDWRFVEINAVSNFNDDIKLGKRKYSRKSTCYIKPVSFFATGDSWRKFYALAQHIEGDCDAATCKYCKNSER